MEHKFTYLLMGILFFIVWIILFVWKKYSRKEMLIASTLCAAMGPLSDVLYTQDWWHPQTLTNTQIGFEAVIVGATLGGIASVLFIDVFKKKLKVPKTTKKIQKRKNINLVLIISISLCIFFGSFYILSLNSLIATLVTFIAGIIFMLYKRPDLFWDSLLSGILLLIVSFIVYTGLEILTPGWIETFWEFQNIPNIVILNVPADDILWYFFAGMFLGPIYEFWQGGKIVSIRK